MSRPAIKLYNFPRSGHAHRAELMLSLLQLPTELIFVDLAKGEHKTPEFLAINPFGQVPAIDDGGTIISDSNAILVYLAKRYGLTQIGISGLSPDAEPSPARIAVVQT